MITENDFMWAICGNPDDMTPRLQFADWLEEQGQVDRSAFIKAQIELAEIGEPWEVLKEVALHRGDGYFQVWRTTDHQEGQRIDCKLQLRGSNRVLNMPGMLVVKIDRSDEWEEWLLLKKDEHSKPFPKKRYEQLKKQVSNCWSNAGSEYLTTTFDLWASIHASHVPLSWYRKGMIEYAEMRVEEWLNCGFKLVQKYPLQEVDLGIEPWYPRSDRWMLHNDAGDPLGLVHSHFTPFLTGEHHQLGYGINHWWYPTRDAAIKDVRRAAVLWARAEAKKRQGAIV